MRDDEPDLVMKEGKAIEIMKEIGFRDIENIFREQMEATIIARK